MIRLLNKINSEKEKLNYLIENSDGNLLSDLIVEQSEKLDKLIVAYELIKHNYRKHYSNNKETKKIYM